MNTRIGWLLVAALAIGSIAAGGAPIHISYVTSESMEPTIDVGDGYILHSAVSIETGDIITFWSEERDDHVTHRVVAVTDDGYITQGDNNPSTDQASGHPPIQNRDIFGEVLTLGPTPLVIPYLGPAVTTVQSNPVLVIAFAGVVLVIASLWRRNTTAQPERNIFRVRDGMRILLAVGLCVGTVSIYFGGALVSVPYMATSEPTDEPYTISTDEPTSDLVSITVDDPPFITSVATSEDVRIVNTTQNASTFTVGVEVPPADEPGYVEHSLTVYSYPTVLPQAFLQRLQLLHPFAAAVTSMGAFLSIPYIASILIVDGRTPVRDIPARWPEKLRRWRL